MFLWGTYLVASISIVLVLMNIIIAIMGEVQGQRGELGRAVVYATQCKVAIEQYSRFSYMLQLDTDKNQWPRYLTFAYDRQPEENEDTEEGDDANNGFDAICEVVRKNSKMTIHHIKDMLAENPTMSELRQQMGRM